MAAKKTVFVLGGWAEGEWKMKHFKQALVEADFELAKDIKSADVVVAHSVGCQLVPHDIKAKLLVLMGPGYGTVPLFLRSMPEFILDSWSIIKSGRLIYLFMKIGYFLGLTFAHPVKSTQYYILVGRQLSAKDLWHKHILVIRNSRDFFSHRDIKKMLVKYPDVKYVELPGQHDNCWTNPQPYIDLIKEEL